MESRGYVVKKVYFEQLPFFEQVRLARSASIMICTYGSNMTNSIFMHRGSTVVVVWPNPHARLFWVNKYCVLHGAAVLRGIIVHVIDKSYDDRDQTDDSMLQSYDKTIYELNNGTLRLHSTSTPQQLQQFADQQKAMNYELLQVDIHVPCDQLDPFFPFF